MRLLLDTNVLIDYYSRREPHWQNALKLRIAAAFGDVELWASSQSFPNIEYILRKAIPVAELREMFTQSMDFLKVCGTTSEDTDAAFRSGWPDLEDFLIARAAKRVKADYLITRDAAGFAQSPVRVMTPTAFIKMLEDEYDIRYEEITL